MQTVQQWLLLLYNNISVAFFETLSIVVRPTVELQWITYQISTAAISTAGKRKKERKKESQEERKK